MFFHLAYPTCPFSIRVTCSLGIDDDWYCSTKISQYIQVLLTWIMYLHFLTVHCMVHIFNYNLYARLEEGIMEMMAVLDNTLVIITAILDLKLFAKCHLFYLCLLGFWPTFFHLQLVVVGEDLVGKN